MEIFTYIFLIAILCYLIFCAFKNITIFKKTKKNITPIIVQTKRSRLGSPRKKT